MKKKYLLLTLFLGLILILAACGGDNDTTSEAGNTDEAAATVAADDSAAEEEAEEESEASGEAAPNNEVTVVGFDFGFDQDEYVVQSGEEVTLTFVNDEGNHGIAIDELDVDIHGDGEAVFIPEEPGRYEIYCNIYCGEGHGDMVATLVVL